MRKINRIVIHCSASAYGNVEIIDGWHKERGFKCVVSPTKTIHIGYHHVILNSFPTGRSYFSGRPEPDSDGIVETGRPVEKIGAHVKGFNRSSIGICLIGYYPFTGRQYSSLKELVWKLLDDFPACVVLGHNELNRKKSCPNLDMDEVRKMLNFEGTT